MPTGKSSSAKKSKTTEDAKLQHVTQWAKNELADLQLNSELPVCIHLQTGDYLVGTYKVEKISTVCWKVDDIEFNDKRGAIFFCVLNYLRRTKDAAELRDADWQVGKLDLDKSIFRVRLDNAHLDNDQFKIDLYSSKYEDAKRKLVRAKQEFEKIINKVRYIMR